MRKSVNRTPPEVALTRVLAGLEKSWSRPPTKRSSSLPRISA